MSHVHRKSNVEINAKNRKALYTVCMEKLRLGSHQTVDSKHLQSNFYKNSFGYVCRGYSNI